MKWRCRRNLLRTKSSGGDQPLRVEQLESRQLLSGGAFYPLSAPPIESIVDVVYIGTPIPAGDSSANDTSSDPSDTPSSGAVDPGGDLGLPVVGGDPTRGGVTGNDSTPSRGPGSVGIGWGGSGWNVGGTGSHGAQQPQWLVPATDGYFLSLALTNSSTFTMNNPGRSAMPLAMAGTSLAASPTSLRNSNTAVNLVQASGGLDQPGQYSGGGDSLSAPRLEPTHAAAPVSGGANGESLDPTFLGHHHFEPPKSTGSVVVMLRHGGVQTDAEPQATSSQDAPVDDEQLTGDERELMVDPSAATAAANIAAAMINGAAAENGGDNIAFASMNDSNPSAKHGLEQQMRMLAVELTRRAAAVWAGVPAEMPLLMQIPGDAAAMDEALDQLMQQLDDLGSDVADWIGERLPPHWTMIVVGAGIVIGHRRVRASRRRAREEEQDQASIARLFARVHGLEIQY